MLSELWLALRRTYGWAPRKMQSMSLCDTFLCIVVTPQDWVGRVGLGGPAQDWVGRVVGYAVAHDQDRDIKSISDIHKLLAALEKRPASALPRPVRRSQVR